MKGVKVLSPKEILFGLNHYKDKVLEYDEKFRSKGILPKNYDYRPYRWCSNDIVFALTVVRHNRGGNFLEVDVCLITNPPQYVDHSGAKAALGFLLSEAFRCGGTMEIVFTKNIEGGRVPEYICDLALEMGVKLNHVFEGHITPFESRQLYLELIGFSKQTKARIMDLAVSGDITPERACFVCIGGIWTIPEVESIILSCDHPETILASVTIPEDRHLYLNDLIITRSAVLGGALDRKLLRMELTENGQIVESEDVEAPIRIDFDPGYFARIYQTEANILIPWLYQGELTLEPGRSMIVMIRARSEMEIRRFFPDDLKSLQSLVEKYHDSDTETMIFLLTPRDFEDIPMEQQEQMVALLESTGVYLMVSPESFYGLTKEAIHRLETGKVTRQ